VTDQDDLDLRQRLARLAAATPDMPPQALGAVPVVRVRRRSLAFGSLAPVLALVVVGIVLAGLTQVGPFATGSAGRDAGVSATSRSGDFELTVHASKMAYEVGAPIHVTAALTYHGGAPVDISHAYKGPLGFGVVEPVNGLTLSPAWRQSCQTQTLAPGDRLTKDFVKSGGFDGADPSAGAYASFFADPGVLLSAGTWHVYAAAEFSIGDCGAASSSMRAEITIRVDPVAAVATTDPGPRTAPPDISPASQSPSPPMPDEGMEVPLRTANSPNLSGECMAARIEGILSANVTTGLGIRSPIDPMPSHGPLGSPVVVDVVWPFGWTARRVGEDVLLFDDAGAYVARTGDEVAFAGGFVEISKPGASAPAEGPFLVCGPRMPRQSPAR
jgi:hypothetical protein